MKVENVSKQYRLGLIGSGTISHDLNRWWARIRGKEDPFLKIGEENDRSVKSDSQYVWALKDISFDVKRGEVLGIIGKNGAGKSTLLKILSQVTSPTTGIIKSRGRIASLLEVGTGFHPEMTGKENIFLNGAILGMNKKEIQSKLEEIIQFSGCEKYIDTPVKRYSSGMKVRLAFAVAAHLEPDILVVDEVLAVGDAEFQKKAIGKMQDISQGDGRTVLFVSHDMNAVQNMCENSIVLDKGGIVFHGDTKRAIDFYLQQNNGETDDHNNSIDRVIDKEFYVKNISINNIQTRSANISSGDSISLKFSFNTKKSKEDAKSISFYVVIKNHMGYPILTISNRYDQNFKVDQDEIDFIECMIPSFVLVEGTYRAMTWFSFKGGFCDEFTDAFELHVNSSDYYKTGQVPISRKHGHFLIKQNWDVG